MRRLSWPPHVLLSAGVHVSRRFGNDGNLNEMCSCRSERVSAGCVRVEPTCRAEHNNKGTHTPPVRLAPRTHPARSAPGPEVDVDDPHALLGISSDASDREIRAAYRSAARAHHPDRGGDPAHFRAVVAAYRQLSDPAPSVAASPDGPGPRPDLPPAPPAPFGPWQQAARWPVVRWSAGLVFLALRVAASGNVVGAVVGLWVALCLVAPTVLVWAVCALLVTLTGGLPPTPPMQAPVRFVLAHLAIAAVVLPLVWLSSVAGGWSLVQAIRAVAAVARWVLS